MSINIDGLYPQRHFYRLHNREDAGICTQSTRLCDQAMMKKARTYTAGHKEADEW
ncbi:MAG: hypothetical protein LBF77_07425 [Spirochaetaceae bacterium]|nr:hypothetical protein [Spirochaetaceae bacterium]